MEELEKIERVKNEKLENIESVYQKNKDKVIDFLFNSILSVEIKVPDVVKGNFEEKFI
jgi:hypothetical protein